MVRPGAQGPRPVSDEDPGAHGGPAGRPCPAGDAREWQALRRGEEGGPVLAGLLRLVRGGGPADDRRVDSLAPADEAVLGDAAADRARCGGVPGELPRDDGHAQDLARPRGWVAPRALNGPCGAPYRA